MAVAKKKINAGTKAYMKNRGTGVPTKKSVRTYKHDVQATFIKGEPTRKMVNRECGKGRGFSCTRPRGHTGTHYATHPPLSRSNIPGKKR